MTSYWVRNPDLGTLDFEASLIVSHILPTQLNLTSYIAPLKIADLQGRA